VKIAIASSDELACSWDPRVIFKARELGIKCNSMGRAAMLRHLIDLERNLKHARKMLASWTGKIPRMEQTIASVTRILTEGTGEER
jgi:hypothetical protein